MSDTTPRVAIYARISSDPTGQAVGVTRQRDDARTLCEARGWTIIAEHQDNDISALTGKHRPGYDAVMADVRARRIDKVVVFHTSRLWRNRLERAQGIRELSAAGVSVAAVRGPELDLTTAYGRGLAGLMGEFDTLESEVKGERVQAAHARRAREGRASGQVAYGWRRTRVAGPERFRDVVDEEAAYAIRTIVTMVLAGESIGAITRRLNAEGVTPPRIRLSDNRDTDRGWCAWPRRALPEEWTPTTVRKVAVRPANAGLRIYHRGRPDEQFFTAAWDPIITRDEYAAVQRRFKPGAASGVRSDRRYLLTWGVGYCGVCGDVLRSAARGKRKDGKVYEDKRMYACDSAKSCVGREITRVDDFVAATVCARLTRPDAAALLDPPAEDDGSRRAALADLRRKVDEATESFTQGRIGIEQLEAITAALGPRIEELEVQAPRLTILPPGLAADVRGAATAEDMRVVWDGWDIAQRRSVLEALGVNVVLEPTARGPVFHPEHVRITFGGPITHKGTARSGK